MIFTWTGGPFSGAPIASGAIVFDWSTPFFLAAEAETLTGTASLAFTNSGALTGQGALTGEATLEFTPASDLTGTGEITGSSSIEFTVDGDLGADGALTGESAVEFSLAGDLVGSGALTGEAGVEFDVSGDLSTEEVTLTGVASMSFAASGTLSGDLALSGTATLSFAVSGRFPSLDRDRAGVGFRPPETRRPEIVHVTVNITGGGGVEVFSHTISETNPDEDEILLLLAA